MFKAVRSVGVLFVLMGALLAGCGAAPLLKGNQAFHDGEFAAAEARWKPLAEAGNFHAQHNLGVLYKTLGDLEIAAFWWGQAVAQEFLPSMLELGALKLAEGEPDEAEKLYRRAARWGSADAIAVLEAWDKPVPYADLFFARQKRLEIQQTRMAWSRDREMRELGPQDVIDYGVAIAESEN